MVLAAVSANGLKLNPDPLKISTQISKWVCGEFTNERYLGLIYNEVLMALFDP